MSENEGLLIVFFFAMGLMFIGLGVYGLYEFHGGKP